MNNQELVPSNKLTCLQCQLSHIKRNGHTYYGKQNNRCLTCGRQFVIREATFDDQRQQLICRLLLERISLRGICRVLDISLCWLMNFIDRIYRQVPDDLNFLLPNDADFQILSLEADELWSFAGKKKNKR